MAEFCWECWNKLNKTKIPPYGYILSWGKEMCEECMQWKRVVVGIKPMFWPECYDEEEKT